MIHSTRWGHARAAGCGLTVLALTLGWGLAAPPLQAAPAPRRAARPAAVCQVHVILGQKKPGAFPKPLAHLRSRLQVKPFSVFKSFQLLKTTSLVLHTGQPSRAPTVGRYRLEAELLSQVVSARRQDRLRFTLTLTRLASGQRPAKRMIRSVLVLDRGGTLFLAGPRYQGGTLVFGLTCK